MKNSKGLKQKYRKVGEIYKEEILPREDLVDITLPSNYGESKIIKELFGFRLVSGKSAIECKTEEEARYIKVFWDTGLDEIKIPKDSKFLKEVTIKIEESKAKLDSVMNSYMRSLLRKNDRERLKRRVYNELIEH